MRQTEILKTLILPVLLAWSSPAWGSSAGFDLRSQGIDLGKAEEAYENSQPQPPRYHVKVERGKTFTLTAQGMAYPRGKAGEPCQPDAGRWRFDAEDLTAMPVGAKEFDKTIVPVRLRADTIGRTRIRFVGKVLGYEHSFDILVDVIAAKDK